jgi:hypothetical protein
MNPWPFVYGAYAFTILGTVLLAASSWAAMRRAEADAGKLSERQ